MKTIDFFWLGDQALDPQQQPSYMDSDLNRLLKINI
jgi:hypothetical protein